MYERLLKLPQKLNKSFFLWGPRQSGKTTLLKKTYPDALRIDLLRNEVFVELKSAPHRLREIVAEVPKDRLIVIDEIQKVPKLLDEIHFLIQEDCRHFALCGSSARKVKSGHANTNYRN